jgi:hypothetical protein
MPSTSQAMLDYMARKHGEDFDDETARDFLESHGYTLRQDWRWDPPKGITIVSMSEDEWLHLRYLMEEWDYGGLA